jgi:c-di-GMP-binding flagellar brake protein YcgR
MTENNRKFARHEIQVDVQLAYLENETQLVHTRDISEGGMFLVTDNASEYPLGEMVHLKYNDPTNNKLETEMDAIIVRVADDGIGIAFVILDEF